MSTAAPEPASPITDAPPGARPLAGMLWMVVTGFMFLGVTATVKLVGTRLPAAESAFLRYLLGLVFLAPMLPAVARARLGLRDVGFFVLRGAFHTLAVILWFHAMTQIPIAEVTAMNYLTPVYVTLGAALFLGERLALVRLSAVAAAMVGALLILRPGFRELSSGHLAMLGTSAFFAGSYLSAKALSGRFSPTVVVAMLSIVVTIGLAPFAAAVWVAPTLRELVLLFLVACFATAGHFTMTLAFRAAPVSLTQPVTFLQLVWATIVGWWIFDEPVDGWVVAGGALIIGAASLIAWREAQLRARRA